MLKNKRHTGAGEACTELIIETFRLNGRLLLAGDSLMRPIGLTSARWQVLGAIGNAHAPQSVAQIARSMGLRRQGIQRVVDLLVDKGLLTFADNPRHQRAKLVTMTAKGRAVHRKTVERQAEWVNRLSAGIDAGEMKRATAVMRTLNPRLSEPTKGKP